MSKSNSKKRIVIVVSHPIQHFCPQYISFSKFDSIELKIFFASAIGYKKFEDAGFGNTIIWNSLRLNEFNHLFLNGDNTFPPDQYLDAPSLNAELSGFQPDVVFIYGYFQKFQRRAQKWAKANRIPIVYISDSENRQPVVFWKAILKFLYLKWYFKKINYFFTIGDANEQYYKQYGVADSKLIKMHFPIDIDAYKIAYENRIEYRNTIRQRYHFDNSTFVIAVVGKLVEWKNQDHLIDLLLNLEKIGRKAGLLVVGTGRMLRVWQTKSKLLQSNIVHFTGFIEPEILPSYYAACDLYIHPARVEPHSLAISEAIYMGCPVIVSDQCGSYGEDDDVQIGKNGYVYKFGDIGQLTELVIKLMDDRKLLELFSKNSHQIAQEFQIISHKKCLEELINKL